MDLWFSGREGRSLKKDKKEKRMDLELGERTISIFEKLANQIGTTVENVFPWYVKQQLLEGWLFLGIFLLIIIVCFIIISKTYSKATFSPEPDRYGIASIISIFCLIFILIVLLCIAPEVLTKIINPKLLALQEIIIDARKLIG